MKTTPALHISGYTTHYIDSTVVQALDIIFKDNDGSVIDRCNVFTDRALPETQPKIDRISLLAEAICKFLNTGGTIDQIDEILNKLEKLPEVTLPENCELFSTEETEHCFVIHNEKTKEFIRVVENEFTELMTEEEYVEFATGKRKPIMISEPNSE